MSRYIDVQKLLDWIKDSLTMYGNTYTADQLNMWGLFEVVIKNTPTADVEPVVRCKDCKWYDPPHIAYNNGGRKNFYEKDEIEYVTADIGGNIGGTCMGHKTYCTSHDKEDAEDCENIIVFREPDDYCSYGERKCDE